MPTGPAARILDATAHPLPGILVPAPGSMNVLIGFRPAWRGIPLAAAAALQVAKAAADTAVAAASGTPGAPAAQAAALTAMSTAITSASAGADINVCATPAPPHGPGVVINGSATVMINMLPPARMGDSILEALGPPNSIVSGEPTVIIGG